MNGFINLLKPPGMSSAALVGKVKRCLPKGTRVGHMGTLDPEAAGVLPIAIGQATRLFDYLHEDKVYRAEVCFGAETDTGDSQGKILRTCDYIPTEEEVLAAFAEFVGEIEQVPPVYAAIKQNGHKLYELARKGIEVEVPSRRVQIFSIDQIIRRSPTRYLFTMHCSRGTYVRALCRDVAQRCGTCGHMSFLLRMRSGIFDVHSAMLPGDLQEETENWKWIPIDAPLGHLKRVDVGGPSVRHMVKNGNPLRCPDDIEENEPCTVYCDGEFAGIAARQEKLLRFRAMLLPRQ